MKCRHCNTPLKNVFADLQSSPPSNSFLTQKMLSEPELYYPLKVFVCESCFLVQVDELKSAEDIFNDEYVYFSSYSKSWLAHSKSYCNYMIDRFDFNQSSLVIEVA